MTPSLGATMGTTYTVGCLLCGRTVGFVHGRQFVASPGSPGIRREGRRLRCGYCRGSILAEPDPTIGPPDWVAEAQRELAVGRDGRTSKKRRTA